MSLVFERYEYRIKARQAPALPWSRWTPLPVVRRLGGVELSNEEAIAQARDSVLERATDYDYEVEWRSVFTQRITREEVK